MKEWCALGSFHVLGLGVFTSLLFNVFTRLQTKKFAKTESCPKGNLETSFVYLFLLALQVLFRYAIAIFKYMESVLLKQCDYMTIYNTLRDGLEYLTDMPTLTQVSPFLYKPVGEIMDFIISRSVKMTRDIMLLLHRWIKIKKLLLFCTHSGLNKVYISLASLGEIKNFRSERAIISLFFSPM